MHIAGKSHSRQSIERRVPQPDSPEGFLSEEETRMAFEKARSLALGEIEKAHASIEAVQNFDAEAVTKVQGILGHGYTLGTWHTPRQWAFMVCETQRNVPLRERVIENLSEQHKRMVQESDTAHHEVALAVEAGSVLSPLPASSRVQRILDGAVLAMSRYLLLCRMGPAGLSRGTKRRSLDPNTVSGIAYQPLPELMAVAVAKLLDRTVEDEVQSSFTLTTGDGYFRLVREADLGHLTASMRRHALTELKRMRVLRDQGLWSDIEDHAELQTTTDPTKSGAPLQEQDRLRDSHRPLPDDYVSEMGRKSLWVVQQLGPSLLTVLNAMLDVFARTESLATGYRQRKIRSSVGAQEWRNTDGDVIESLPFTIGFNWQDGSRFQGKDTGGEIETEDDTEDVSTPELVELKEMPWPPSNFEHILALCALLQRAHIFVVSMCEAPRAGELLTQSRHCVEYAANGMYYANGRTFKIKRRHNGEERQWVLPKVGVQAMEQQARLVHLLERLGPITRKRASNGSIEPLPKPGNHLWGSISATSWHAPHLPLTSLNHALKAYAASLGMSIKPGGQNLRSHRFRPTLARLAALALTDSPKIMMDVLGHDDIETTLGYMMADKDLQADINKVTREMRVMRAKDTVAAIVAQETANDVILSAASGGGPWSKPPSVPPYGGFGGGAAPRVAHEIEVHKARVHKMGRAWGAEDIHQLAERFIAMNMSFDLVMPGVICIKKFTQKGACSFKIGARDASNCKSDCDYHLAAPLNRERSDGAIRDSLRLYHEAGAQPGNELEQAVWAAQILAHLPTYEDVRAKWMEDPTVREIVEKEAKKRARLGKPGAEGQAITWIDRK